MHVSVVPLMAVRYPHCRLSVRLRAREQIFGCVSYRDHFKPSVWSVRLPASLHIVCIQCSLFFVLFSEHRHYARRFFGLQAKVIYVADNRNHRKQGYKRIDGQFEELLDIHTIQWRLLRIACFTSFTC